MAAARLEGQASIDIAASPDAVYALVSDVTRTGEWSPQCERCEWISKAGAAPAPGDRFTGHNREGSRAWSMTAVVEEAVPAQSFSFHTERAGTARSRWSYRIEPSNKGSRVTESYARLAAPGVVARAVERLVLGDRRAANDANIRSSLERIKSILEAM